MGRQKPVNLDLTTISFPLPAIISILHRMSGVFLFLALPFLLWGLDKSLQSPQSFVVVKEFFASPVNKFILWFILAALGYHLIAGIRHLLMDWGIGESLSAGSFSSKLVLVVSIVLAILLGWWLW